MEPLSDDRVVFLDDVLDLSSVDVVDWGEVVQIRPKSISPQQAKLDVSSRREGMSPYLRDEMGSFHYRDNPRIQPLILLAQKGWEITSHLRWADDLARHRKRGGAHGYDPRHVSMQGIFIAAGPRIRRGVVVPSFENIHVYDFLCAVLGVKPAPNDGDPAVTRGFLAY